MQDTQTNTQKPKSDITTLESLIRENLALTREIAEHARKTRRYILFAQILNILKVVLIIGPIIFAIIYLPPLIQQWLGAYSDLLGGGTGQTVLQGNSFINQLFNSQQK
jgi:O-antigen/teichoic acid export membrane protein